MIEWTALLDGATLAGVLRAVWMLSEVKCKIRSLEARIKRVETLCPVINIK